MAPAVFMLAVTGLHTNIPAYAWAIIVLVTLAYVPVALYTDYTLRSVYTTLAIVENPTPAAYEAVSSEDADVPPVPSATADGEPVEDAGTPATPAQPITASLRRTHRLLVATSGWRGNFRGLGMAVILVVASSVVGSLFSVIPFVPSFLAQLPVSLALVQLSTAWVHTVLRTGTSTSPRPSLRQSLPPFRRTLMVAGGPVALSWLASAITLKTCSGLASLLHLADFLFQANNGVDGGDDDAPNPVAFGSVVWRVVLIGLIWVVLAFVLVLPAYIVQIRVQASLLPAEADTIVPFDRSFSGTVEPEIVGGRGYVTMRDALRTFSPSSWRRLVVLYVKATLASVAAHTAYLAVIVPVIFFTVRKADPGTTE